MSFRIKTSLKIAKLFKNSIFSYVKFPFERHCSTVNNDTFKKKKMEDFFFDQKVQHILKKITGMDLEKIFSPKPTDLEPHVYEFATEKRLKELQDEVISKAIKKLQMPPVMDIREPIDEVLDKTPELQGYLDYKLIFTDVSLSVSSRDRMITVRETDGTLRKARWDERFKMNQIFFPMPGRSLETPKLFESPYLDRLLEEGSYMFILDSACCQFEPDDPDYHRVTNTTYEHIQSKKMFDVLRSTRHFGPMAFYFAYNKNIDSLLVDMIERQLISDAAHTIKLMSILHPELKIMQADADGELKIVQNYVETCSSQQKSNLELALQTYLETQSSKKRQEMTN